MIGTVNQVLFFANILLWSVLIGAFVVVKIRTSITRRKYSKKQENEVAQEYHSTGLHQETHEEAQPLIQTALLPAENEARAELF